MKRRIEIFIKNKEHPISIDDDDDKSREEFRKSMSQLFTDPNLLIGEFELTDIIARPSDITFIKINNDPENTVVSSQQEQNTKADDTKDQADVEDIITDV